MDPHEIETVEFRVTRIREGYDADQVDAFLDRVAADHRTVQQALLESQEKLQRALRRAAEAERARGEAPTQVIAMDATRILEAAQRTADDVIREATAQAAEAVAEAQREVDERTEQIRILRSRECEIREWISLQLRQFQSGLNRGPDTNE